MVQSINKRPNHRVLQRCPKESPAHHQLPPPQKIVYWRENHPFAKQAALIASFLAIPNISAPPGLLTGFTSHYTIIAVAIPAIRLFTANEEISKRGQPRIPSSTNLANTAHKGLEKLDRLDQGLPRTNIPTFCKPLLSTFLLLYTHLGLLQHSS